MDTYGPAQELCTCAQGAQAATRAPPHPPHNPPWCQPWPRSSSRRRKPICSGQFPKANRSGRLTRPLHRGPNSCRPRCSTTRRRRAHPLRRREHRALRRPACRQPRRGTRGPSAGRNAARSKPRQQRKVRRLSPSWPWERRPRERQCRPEGCRLGPWRRRRAPGPGKRRPRRDRSPLIPPTAVRPRAATPRLRRTSNRPPRRSSGPPVGSGRKRGLGRRPGASLRMSGSSSAEIRPRTSVAGTWPPQRRAAPAKTAARLTSSRSYAPPAGEPGTRVIADAPQESPHAAATAAPRTAAQAGQPRARGAIPFPTTPIEPPPGWAQPRLSPLPQP